ncbi:Ribonuclease Z [uncultured archaeon]|nr:Ribonuclease Z [uncultured archaeon]
MTSKINITFLGTADQIPSANRNHTAILLSYNSENILIDCGEGTQRQFRKAGLNPCKISRILITHWHGDHVLGLPGLFQTLAASGYNKTLHLYGPRGIKLRIEKMLDLFGFKKELLLEVHEIGPGKFLDEEEFYLEAGKAFHGTPTNIYSFVKKGLLRIDKQKLKKAKLPDGPLLGKIKNKQDITYEGKKFKWKDLTYQDESVKISFIVDSLYDKSFIPFVKDSRLLVCESEFSSEIKEKAQEHLHMTAEQVGELAKKSKVKQLILTHISQRYEHDMKKILDEAKVIFRNVTIAKDLDSITIDGD